MAAVKSGDTRPELIVRRFLHARGFRYRLHVAKLPGKPDIVLPKHKTVINVHGCFWHGHDCHNFRPAKTNSAWWAAKIQENQARDRRNVEKLEELGWKVITVWECQINQPLLEKLADSIG